MGWWRFGVNGSGRKEELHSQYFADRKRKTKSKERLATFAFQAKEDIDMAKR